MTETEWRTATDPTPMLGFLRGRTSERKFRLFACACCWRVRHLFQNDASGDALNASEQFADGMIDQNEMQQRRIERRYARNLAHPPTQAVAAASHERRVQPEEAAQFAADAVADTQAPMGEWSAVRAGEQRIQRDLLRDIVGNPFYPVSADPSWRSSDVLALAEAIYAERAFDRLPILADALEEADCDNADVLDHCRGSGPHVRGCWVVDLLIGKQ